MPTASASLPVAPRKSFRETQFVVRAEAILNATNHLLASKGYEEMAMDDIAAEVGIAKGSLYKHFESKEALAAAVMVRLLDRTRDALEALPAEQPAIERLRELLRWTLRERLAGGVPHLPSTSRALRDSLMANRHYIDQLMSLSERIGTLIKQARADGALRADLSDEFILYSFYARSCDPTLDYLKSGDSAADSAVVEQMISSCFDGLGPGR